MRTRLKWLVVFLASMWTNFAAAADPIDIGSRRELFVDEALIERLEGQADLRLQHPTPREVAITFEKPWEGNASGYHIRFANITSRASRQY